MDSIDPSGPGHSSVVTGEPIPATGSPAWRLWAGGEHIPVLIAAPHGGSAYPPELTAAMRDPRHTPARLEDRCTDALALAVAQQTGAALILAHTPRALVDLNRAPDDVDWGMIAGPRKALAPHSSANRRARSGLGVVPRRLAGSGEIWRRALPIAELEDRLGRFHAPYHAALGGALEQMRDRWGVAMLIDLHSMPPLARGADGTAIQVVLGDRFGASCAGSLVARAGDALSEVGLGWAVNRPYAGGYILDRHAAPRRDIHALQVEICRSLYLDQARLAPGNNFAATVDNLAAMIAQVAQECCERQRVNWRDAAE